MEIQLNFVVECSGTGHCYPGLVSEGDSIALAHANRLET